MSSVSTAAVVSAAQLHSSLKILTSALADFDVARCEMTNRHVTVSAADRDSLIAVTTALPGSEPDCHRIRKTVLVSSEMLRTAQHQLSAVGTTWSLDGIPLERLRGRLPCLRPRLSSGPARVASVDAAALSALIDAYRTAPGTTRLIVDATGPTLQIGVDTDLIKAAASVGPVTGGAPAAVGIPISAAAAALKALSGAVTVTVADTYVSFTAHTTSIAILPATTHEVRVPAAPDPGRRRHDVTIDVDDWASYAHATRPAKLDRVPTTHLRVSRTATSQVLHIDTRSAGHSGHAELAASTSDSFSVDVPWPALCAALAPSVAGDANSARLRAFDPNPVMTPLVVSYHGEAFDGFAAVGARRPTLAQLAAL